MFSFFFFHDTATPEIYTLSLHDALPICLRQDALMAAIPQITFDMNIKQALTATALAVFVAAAPAALADHGQDRKSTRLNSSHSQISYAVFCLKKKITNLHKLYIHNTSVI